MYISASSLCAIVINQLGAYFSSSAISRNDHKPFTQIPQVIFEDTDYFKDTVNWQKLTGQFIATGNEGFITIGDFKDTLSTDTLRLLPYDPSMPDFTAYYYIDDVSLIDITDTISPPPPTSSDTVKIPNVFTPNNDGVNDVFRISGLKKGDEVDIYNRWGILVGEINEPEEIWDGRTTGGAVCSAGVYFYIIFSENPKIKEHLKKGVIQLVR
jgi:gliding motility-associated-like protein